MDKVRLQTSGSLGILSLANPPLNLLNLELIEDLQAAVAALLEHGARSFRDKVVFEGR